MKKKSKQTKTKEINRSTEAEIKLRVREISNMLLAGGRYADILRYAADKWGISDRQTDNYIRKAHDNFANSSIFNTDEQLGISLIRLNDLYSKNMQLSNYAGALAAQSAIIKLLGLSAPEESKVHITDETLTDEERYRRIMDILDSARERDN